MPLSVGTSICRLDKTVLLVALYRLSFLLSRSFRRCRIGAAQRGIGRPQRRCGMRAPQPDIPTRRQVVSLTRASRARSAMIIFVDRTECAWLQPLRHGFRHCFVALEHAPRWLVCDSLKSHMELTLLDPLEPLHLAEHYASQGHRVLVGRAGTHHRRSPVALSPLTCVSVAKRLLAIRAPWVWTPWQLFSHLQTTQPDVWRVVEAGGQNRHSSPSEPRLRVDKPA